MAFTFLTQPQSQTAVPGQNTTFTVQASSNDVTPLSAAYTYQWYLSSGATRTAIAGETNSSYTIDPFITDNGKIFFATSTFLSGAPANTFVTTITSNNASLTVAEDVPPYDVQDVWPETGRERHTRLRLLGYI
jgi:hypothetical protein